MPIPVDYYGQQMLKHSNGVPWSLLYMLYFSVFLQKTANDSFRIAIIHTTLLFCFDVEGNTLTVCST